MPWMVFCNTTIPLAEVMELKEALEEARKELFEVKNDLREQETN